MVLDSSVVVAIHLRERGFESLIAAIDAANTIFIGAPTVVESAIVLSARLNCDARPLVNAFLRKVRAERIEFSDDHADAAIAAFLRFGKGRHPAALNYGDCMAYAIASLAGQPLLYKGSDFSKTDLPVPAQKPSHRKSPPKRRRSRAGPG